MDEEKVYNKLKYGTVFACPRCGSKSFVVVTKITVYDTVTFLDDGTVEMELTNLNKIIHNPPVDAWRVYCDVCDAPIPKQKLLRVIKSLGEKKVRCCIL